MWGFEMPISWWFWYAFLHQAGGRLLTADGKQAAFQETGAEVLRFWSDLILKDKTMKRPPGKDYNAWEVANTDFINRRAAMIITSTAFLGYLTENSKFKVGGAFLPGKTRLAAPTGGTFFVMLKDTPQAQKEAGWAFIRWMSEPEQTLYWSKATGYMPVRTSAVQLPATQQFYREQPNYKVAYDQLQHAVRFPFTPALFEIQREQIQNEIEAPLVGLRTIEETMAQAVRGTNALLSNIDSGRLPERRWRVPHDVPPCPQAPPKAASCRRCPVVRRETILGYALILPSLAVFFTFSSTPCCTPCISASSAGI